MNPSIEKRLKRQVIGKVHRFEIFVPLGFEQTIIDEIMELNMDWSSWDGQASNLKIAGDGKVHFTAKLTEAWKISAFSRIANRILMEVGCFKAENFGQLEKGVNTIPWELFLGDCSDPALHVTCKHSRLYHSDAVKERVEKIISKIAEQNKPAEPPEAQQHLYVNLQDDRCTLWLDLAGEELYKRGHERFVAEAPLKETIAAAMIFEASKVAGLSKIDSASSITFVDPMAGSGTFSLEAAYIANGLIPGKCRDFALKHQPAFKEGTWNFILKGAEPAESAPRLITSDISERPISIIKHNMDTSPLAEIAKSNSNAVSINPQLKDFFSYNLSDVIASDNVAKQSKQSSGEEQIIILLNPPYGKRLSVDAPKLYTKIGQKLDQLGRDIYTQNSNSQSRSASLTVAILAPKDDTRGGAHYTCTENLLKACPALDPHKNPAAKLIETSHGGFSLNAIFAKI